jgi:hypothetical protein
MLTRVMIRMYSIAAVNLAGIASLAPVFASVVPSPKHGTPGENTMCRPVRRPSRGKTLPYDWFQALR